MSSGILAKPKHQRAANLCSRGTREWFKRYEWDYTKFVTEGIPVEEFEELGDALGLRVAAEARKEAELEGDSLEVNNG